MFRDYRGILFSWWPVACPWVLRFNILVCLNHYAEMMKTLEVNEIVFYFYLAYATMLFSNIMSNTATSTVLIPLGMAILINVKTEVALIIGLAASTALFLPVSTPPNAIAYSTGLLEQKDFRVGGMLIGLVGPGW